ncbi:MAG TPA: SAM-dependent methyltransferase [Pyrinomonadaceae bacterium]
MDDDAGDFANSAGDDNSADAADAAADDDGRGPESDLSSSAEAPLAVRLREQIRLGGPLTFRDWMAAALYDERGGYYTRRGAERWGRAGDYRTAPERSALFAATFARHFSELHEELGRPRVFHVVEAGGGAGRFAHGVLHALRRDAPHVFDSLRYVYDEAGADSRRRAAALLEPFAGRVEFRRLSDVGRPFDAAVVFSNELLDALPVHRVTRRGGRLRESYVAVDEGGAFVFVEGEPSTPLLAEHFRRAGVTLEEGQTAEVSLAAGEWLRRASRVVGHGFVVTVDYGDDEAALYGAPHRRAGTLRAFRRHRLVEDVLRDPGEQDLTTTVNWTHVIAEGEAAGLRARALERLDAFLLRAGLLEQLELEGARAAGDAETAALRLDAREMILPGGMASHFQVLVQRKEG